MALIVSAFIVTINVTGTETGAFLLIEQAMLPQTINDPKKRNMVYAIYNMAGTFAMSAGVLLSGLPHVFAQQYGLNQIESIKPLFALYSIIGLDIDRFKKEISGHIYAPLINESLKNGIDSGVEGTPTFFVNGVHYEESWDLDTFSNVLKKNLTR